LIKQVVHLSGEDGASMIKLVVLKFGYVFAVFFTLVCLAACKKDTSATNGGISLVGKWIATKKYIQLLNNGTSISTSTKTNFTDNDFVMYYADGSGYFSANIIAFSGPSISEFHYTLTGMNLTQFTGNNPGFEETVASLTSSALVIHAQFLTTDPNNPTVTDTEINDFYYTKAN
jgi:hypothetical protein